MKTGRQAAGSRGNHAAARRLPGAVGPRDRLSAAGRNALAKPVWSSREGRNWANPLETGKGVVMFFGRPVSKNSDCLSLPLSPLPPLAASSRAMTLREVVVTDVTAARESLLPNVQGLDGGQRNLLRLGFLTTGSCVCAHTCNWARCLARLPPQPSTRGGRATQARRRRRRRRKGRKCCSFPRWMQTQ